MSIGLIWLVMERLLPFSTLTGLPWEYQYSDHLKNYLDQVKGFLSEYSSDIEFVILTRVFKTIMMRTFVMNVPNNGQVRIIEKKIDILKTVLKMGYVIALKVLLQIPECVTGIPCQDLFDCSIEILSVLVEYGIEFDKNELFDRASRASDDFKKARYLLEIGADIHVGNALQSNF
jgi:hypothetical protein